MTHTERKRWKVALMGSQILLDPVPEPQDYPGLDAAGLLLVALGHLAKAGEKLDREPPSYAVYVARQNTVAATNFVRYALELLNEQKEETCEKS